MTVIWDIAKGYISNKRVAAKPENALPIKVLTGEKLASSNENALFRLGHSTVLMRLDGEYIITDPMFSDRASPVQWAGPKRFQPAPIAIEELPEIKVVVISHDHYDHLDKETIKRLADKVEHFVTPLKVGDYLIEWGIDRQKVTQLDWWQSVELDSFKFIATPAQHFSGRGLLDRNRTLWASWVIQSSSSKLFFSGDGGYFGGFKEIGERFGPFDITMMETGAYNDLWSDIHMLPEQSMQAHLELQGKAMLPIHNGTFDLSLHDWYEPFDRISALAKEHNVKLLIPIFGETVSIKKPVSHYAWWQDMQPLQATKLAME